jgi:membrane protease YdiL (CAAX protease family)
MVVDAMRPYWERAGAAGFAFLEAARRRRTLSAYVLALAAAEVVAGGVDPVAGVACDGVLLVVLLNHALVLQRGTERDPELPAAAIARERRPLLALVPRLGLQPVEERDPKVPDAAIAGECITLLALALVPLLQILGFVMPVRGVPEVYWYALAGVPLALALAVVARLLGPDRRREVLRFSWSRREAAVVALGVPVGLVAYATVRPDTLGGSSSRGGAAAAALLLVAFAGFAEEIVFRGFVLRSLVDELGPSALVWSTLLFAGAYAGSSLLLAAVMAAAGLAAGWWALRSGSLLGVSLAHGVVAFGALVFWPQLFG